MSEPGQISVQNLNRLGLDRKPLIYLGSPYSDPDDKVREDRYEAVCAAAARLMNLGNHVFCPIAHTHNIAHYLVEHVPEARQFDFWREFDLRMLSMCDILLVLTLPGWSLSNGLHEEIKYAKETGLAIVYWGG